MEQYYLKDPTRYVDATSPVSKKRKDREDEDLHGRLEMSPADKKKSIYGDKAQGKRLISAKRTRAGAK